MSCLSIQVEVLGGTDFKQAAWNAIRLAKELKLAYVCFDFNGVSVRLSPRATVSEAHRVFFKEIRSEGTHKVVIL